MRIMVVEDDPGIREVIHEYLTTLGHTVDISCNGKEALELLQLAPTSYDVALVDWKLPGITGRDVIQDIIHCSPRTQILITTGQSPDRLIQQSSRHPQVQVLSKPFTLRQLHTMVKSAVAQPAGPTNYA